MEWSLAMDQSRALVFQHRQDRSLEVGGGGLCGLTGLADFPAPGLNSLVPERSARIDRKLKPQVVSLFHNIIKQDG